MKKRILFFLVFSIINLTYIYPQNGGSSSAYENEIRRTVKIPKTPESSSFTEYGKIETNLFLGQLNVSIPIYSYEGREMVLPLSLTYDSSGVKVDQRANQIGLNWNLLVGGRITKTVNGLSDGYIYATDNHLSIYSDDAGMLGPDTGKSVIDLIEQYKHTTTNTLFESIAKVKAYLFFLKYINDNKIDTQPDYYHFVANGISEDFVYDIEKKEFRSLSNPRTKVEAFFTTNSNGISQYVYKFIITTEDGTKCFFEETQMIHSINDAPSSTSSVKNYDTWLLTKMISPNNKDVFVFEYEDLGEYSDTFFSESSITHVVDEEIIENLNTSVNQIFYKNNMFLKNIYYFDKKIIEITNKSRYDLSLDNAIDTIRVIDANSNIIKKIIFNHSYFGIDQGEDPSNVNENTLRLKLDEVLFANQANDINEKYTMEYINPEQVPYLRSYSQDFLGLYNGATNSVLYPAVGELSGADRKPNFAKAITGTLEKITYPTGGCTMFEYEPNSSPLTPSDVEPYETITLVNVNVGGEGNYPCNNCLFDVDGTCPEIVYSTIHVSEPKMVTIKITETSAGNGEAYFFFKEHGANVSYDEMINADCSFNIDFLWVIILESQK